MQLKATRIGHNYRIPRSRCLLEKLTAPQLVKIFPPFMEPTFHDRIHNSPPPVVILNQNYGVYDMIYLTAIG